VAPLRAMRVPVAVSPIFMLEVSTAATTVALYLGWRGVGVSFMFRLWLLLNGC